MYHIRSRISGEERYRDLTTRAWRSLFLCTACGAVALACAWFAPSQPSGWAVHRAAKVISLWEQENEPQPPEPAHALQLPPLAAPDIALPEPQATPPEPAEADAAPLDFFLAEANGVGESLFPTPETLGESPRPQRRSRAAAMVSTPTSAAAAAPALAETTPPAYRENPAPPYPPAMREERAEGSVRVRICVDAAGRPTRVDILQSSGHRALDTTARDWILRRWLFSPARSGGKPIAGIVATHIRFVLD